MSFKSTRSCFPRQSPKVRATDAPVLGEADAAAGWELGGFDLPNGAGDHLPEAVALLLGDGGAQILDLDQPLAHEDHKSDVGFSGDPGVTDELGVQSQQTLRLVGVAGAGGFPVNDRAFSVELADGIDVGDEFVAVSDGARELDLQIAAGIPDLHPVILDKSRD